MPAPLPSILFGALFTLAAAYACGIILLRNVPVPPEITLAAGAAALSFVIFLLLLIHTAVWPVFLAVGCAAIVALKWLHRMPIHDAAVKPLGRARWVAVAVFSAYGVWYFVNALAPETQADGITYHLGLAYKYVRLAGFPSHVAFYDLLPQGMEMLYTMAFAFGRHSAAKLVEFVLFVATVPLIFRIGRRLGMSDLASLVAAVFYFCAPVAGLTGSSSYNDAAGVFFALASFYLLLVWRDTQNPRYLWPAGVLAGFCYAIKFPGVFAVAGAVLFVLLAGKGRKKDAAFAERDALEKSERVSGSDRLRFAGIVAIAAAAVMAPWLLRNAALTGNPVAPLMNGIFPNGHFHLATEKELSANLRSLGSVKPLSVPWELAFGDHLTGTFGPLLLALPLGLLALRRGAGRLCWAAAVLLALPWFSNTGARFLMPSVAFAALALGMALPRPAAWAAIIIQAILCWPQAINQWETRFAFRLHEFPWRAALRLQAEPEYLRQHVEEYQVAKMVERGTPPGARILALLPVANAYLARDASVPWQSAEGDCMLDDLRLASIYSGNPLYNWRAEWPSQTLRALRFRQTASNESEWDIVDVELYAGPDRVYNSPQSKVRAWPNRWEAPLAFDNSLSTRWRTWQPQRAGMYVELDLDYPQQLSSAILLSHKAAHGAPIEFYGQDMHGRWHLLSRVATADARPPQDLRVEATNALRRAGYHYLLTPTGTGGNTPIGNVLMGHAVEWGLEPVGQAGRYYLYQVK
ncbi:MAG TPA: glycosyltransferase family 39 protein [Bryobacteraceae bacterium]|nr:glycosyltransferase family 39 protein [Bryobacteraceae bacterium]